MTCSSGFAGERDDGGEYAAEALDGGRWGVVVEPASAADALARRRPPAAGCSRPPIRWPRCGSWPAPGGASSAVRWSGSPARPGRRRSRTSPRDPAASRVHASPENFNTEIGLPLAILAAPPETEVLVLEMAMRGLGEIAELCEIAEPDVAAITNVGPVHLELLGTIEAIAEAKAEILAGLTDEGAGRVPVEPRRSPPISTTSWTRSASGPAATCSRRRASVAGGATSAVIATPAGEARFGFPFTERHNLANTTLRGGDRRRARASPAGDGPSEPRAYPSRGSEAR